MAGPFFLYFDAWGDGTFSSGFICGFGYSVTVGPFYFSVSLLFYLSFLLSLLAVYSFFFFLYLDAWRDGIFSSGFICGFGCSVTLWLFYFSISLLFYLSFLLSLLAVYSFFCFSKNFLFFFWRMGYHFSLSPLRMLTFEGKSGSVVFFLTKTGLV